MCVRILSTTSDNKIKCGEGQKGKIYFSFKVWQFKMSMTEEKLKKEMKMRNQFMAKLKLMEIFLSFFQGQVTSDFYHCPSL